MEAWVAQWRAMAERVRALGGEAEDPEVEPPATDEEIAAVEETIGRALPESFKRVCREFSRAAEFEWELDDDEGYVGWSLASIPEYEEMREELLDVHGDVARFGRATAWAIEGADQTMIAFDGDAVVLLDDEGCLDDGEAWLAKNFEDFMGRWSRAPVRIYDMEDFGPKAGRGLDPECEDARALRKKLGDQSSP